MEIAHRLDALLAADVGSYHIPLQWTWPNDGNLNAQFWKILWTGARQALHLLAKRVAARAIMFGRAAVRRCVADVISVGASAGRLVRVTKIRFPIRRQFP